MGFTSEAGVGDYNMKSITKLVEITRNEPVI
ncbi:hypothetical protein M2150_001542 [Lachnospiraceae bacterium PM6-15]